MDLPPPPLIPAWPATPAPEWWRRPGLDVGPGGRLQLNGEDLEDLGRRHGTPLFVYDLARPAENVAALRDALGRAGLDAVVRFALKANPLPRILEALRAVDVGIDACSPGEVLHALANGWRPDEISVTATNLSERDLDVLLAHRVHCNLDAVSQVERYGRRAPGTTIGLRVNPGAGAGYGEHLAYAGSRPTKFGVTEDRLADAVDSARRHRLTIDTLHFHAGSGWLGDRLSAFEEALARATVLLGRLLDAGCPIREVNVGGGLGVPARGDEQRVDLDAYAGVIARHLAPFGVRIGCEPGDFVMKDAGVLLGEVVTVERRGDVTFVGLDIGWNVHCAYFIYRYAQELVPCVDPLRVRDRRVTVAGHINEAGDVFAEEYPLPSDLAEGELLAILNAGGYLQAMSSTHCLRPTGTAVFLDRPAVSPPDSPS